MQKLFKNLLYLVIVFIVTTSGENKTDLYASSDIDNKYLNDFINISNSAPEIIDYYDLDVSIDDDVLPTVPPEIYPDPQKVYSTKEHTTISSNNFNRINHLDLDVPKLDHISNKNTNNNEDDVAKNDDLGHDAIDNIMYIYYGSNSARRKSLGGSIIIVGAVFALAAQILAIVLSILRNRRLRRSNCLATITLNLLLTLCASNFIFIIGVQASKALFKCEIIAILLHYFHLATSMLGLCHAYSIYDYVINENAPNIKHNNLVAYCGSGVYVMFSFAISSASYETFDFCWMSVQRGMIVNFMIPISALIVTTTIFGTLTIKAVASKQREVIVENLDNILEKCQHIDSTIEKCCEDAEKVCETDLKRVDFYDSKFDLGALSLADLSLQSSTESQDYNDFKNAVKFSLFFQPAFAVCWFLGVVALENRQSCIMPVAFIVCYNILNWYILYRLDNISPMIIGAHTNSSLTASTLNCSQFDARSNNDDGHEQPTCADTIPLLCSVTTVTAPSIPSNSSHNNSKSLINEDIFSTTCITQNTKIQSWETSMENINLDCISTISN